MSFRILLIRSPDYKKYGWSGTDKNHVCYAKVFDGPHCTGHAFTMHGQSHVRQTVSAY